MKYYPNMPEEEFKNLLAVTQEEIKTAAYYKWEAAGHPTDEEAQHNFWLEAEREAFIRIGLISGF